MTPDEWREVVRCVALATPAEQTRLRAMLDALEQPATRTTRLSLDDARARACPVCGAAPGAPCNGSSGGRFRTTFHWDRRHVPA